MSKRNYLIVMWVCMIFVAILVALIVNLAQGAERDVSINVGIAKGSEVSNDPIWHESSSHDWESYSIDVRFEKNLSDRWLIGSSLRLSQLNFDNKEDSLVLDSTIRLIYEFLRLGPVTFSAEGGVGIAWIEQTPSKRLLNDAFPGGVVNYGVGVSFPVSKKLNGTITGEFIHYSAILKKDSGVNEWRIRIGLEYW